MRAFGHIRLAHSLPLNAPVGRPIQTLESSDELARERCFTPATLCGSLLTIQSPELARLKADWLPSKAKRDWAQAELLREQRLFDAQAGSRRELEATRSEGATANADEEAARMALEACGQNPETVGAVLTLKAAKAGSVTGYEAQLGQESRGRTGTGQLPGDLCHSTGTAAAAM